MCVDFLFLKHKLLMELVVIHSMKRAVISGALPPAPGSSVEIGEPAQRPQAGHEAVFAAPIDDEGWQSLEVEADWLLRDGKFTALVTAH
jgi:hypothetical protein